MKEIKLTRGYVAIVDDEDYEWLSKFKWCAMVEKSGRVSAVRNLPTGNGKYKTVYMHRIIMNEPIGVLVDHADRNPLNNQRYNLRVCTHAENLRNRGKQKNNTTGFCGVVRNRKGFQAKLKINGKDLYFGTYPTPEEAARAYDVAAKIHHGEFASYNFPKR